MSLSSTSIRRPVFTLVLSLLIVIFGVVGFTNLGVREYPLAERPIISVATNYPGANAEVIENQITEPLEAEINVVAGIKTLTSVSREGRSTIRAEFELGEDLDRAANDIRDRVAAAVRNLPPDADPPRVTKADGDGDPIVFLNIQSERRSLLGLTDLAENLIKPRVENIEGVARVDIWGSKTYAMRLWMDPLSLAAYGLGPTDVRDAFRRANVELPSGYIEGDLTEITIRSLSRLSDDPEEFNEVVIARNGDSVVRFRDVGYAEIAPLNERTILRRDGVPMVGLVIRPQTGANEIAIVDEFYRRLDLLKPELPEDIALDIGFDTSEFIRASVAEVQRTIFIALGLVCLTILFFLREWRPSIIPLITIPVALTGTFFILSLSGFTINVLTLLGMVLAVGLVVDDAIVVVENIYRKIEEGKPSREAGIEGVREIFLAVIATTLSLIAVFLPILFLGGLTGMLFREFGMTLAGAVAISSFVVLTLGAMLSSRILLKRERHPPLYRATEPFFEWLNALYRNALGIVLRARWVALIVLVVCAGLMVLLFQKLPRDLIPGEDRSLLVLMINGPQGVNFEYMDRVMNRVDTVAREEIPERKAQISVTSPGFGAGTTVNSGFSRFVLVDPSERRRSQGEIQAHLSRTLAEQIPEAQISVFPQAPLRALGRGQPIQFVIQHPDFETLAEVLDDFLFKARQRPEFGFVRRDLELNQPELEIRIDRSRADILGVPVQSIAETLQAAFSGQRFGFFLRDGRQYEIIGQLMQEGRNEPEDVSRLVVRNAGGEWITLDNLVELQEVTTAPVRYRHNRFPSATFQASLSDGYTIPDGIAAMEEVAASVLNSNFTTDLAGQSREFRESGQSLLWVFLFAILLVYLVLAAQFESFRDPLIIMLTVPLALTGGLIALFVFGQTLNLFSQIGLIMLIGLVTKNGILVVEFANQRQRAGLPILEAVTEAAAIRFRPILMTTTSTILGTLPIALAFGAGAETRGPLGLAVIGGLMIGSFFTLFVIPAAYTFLASDKQGEDSLP